MNDELLLTGRTDAPEPARRLHAGDLSLELHGADVRRVSYRGIEVLSQAYFALRDGPWNTLPGVVADYRLDEHADGGFSASFRSRHAFEALGIDLSYVGTIVGTTAGELIHTVEVTAGSTIEYNRIGLNLLHGARTYKGRPFRSWLGDDMREGQLPQLIGPQPYVGARLAGLIAPFDRLELSPVDGVTVRLEFEGDEFEMEDQRNFGDSTFKTYSTPLQRPAPFRLEPGGFLRQSVTISVRDERAPSSMRAPHDGRLTLTIGTSIGRRVPAFGLGQPDDAVTLTGAERARIAPLAPDHLRAELDLARGLPTCLERLATAAAEARALGCALWLDIFAAATDREVLLAVVRAACAVDPAPAYVYLATAIDEPPDTGVSAEMLAAIRALAAVDSPSTAVGAGSYFSVAGLNRAPFDGAVVENVTFPTCPTIHRSDDITVLENIDGLADEVATIRRYVGDRSVTVGPITLASRHGPYPDGPRRPGDLPSRVDVRQVAALAAVLTLGQLAEFARAGVDGLTFFETVGPLGVTERDSGSSLPYRFRSTAGQRYPLWHVLMDAAELRGGELLEISLAPAPVFTPSVVGLAVRDGAGTHLLIASTLREAQSIAITGFSGPSVRIRTLDVATTSMALDEPDTFRASGAVQPVEGGRVHVDLGAYAVVRIESAPTSDEGEVA